jgi:hypothetical protein
MSCIALERPRTRRESLLDSISEAHKDAYGTRGYSEAYANDSEEELVAELERLSDAVVESIRSEAVEKLAAQKEWEKDIVSFIELGAKTRADALRWDIESYDVRPFEWADDGFIDISYYCHLRGLDYALETRIREELKGD